MDGDVVGVLCDVGVFVCGGRNVVKVEIKEGWGDAGTLGDPEVYVSECGGGPVVDDGLFTALKVVTEPFDESVWKVRM